MARILIIDDERSMREALRKLLEFHGHDVVVAEDGQAGIDSYREKPADLLIIDLNMAGMNGIETLAKIREFDPQALGMFLTAFGSIESAVEAIKAGGFDFLQKPFDNNKLILDIARALKFRELSRRVVQLEEDLESTALFPTIVGNSPAIRKIKRLLAKVASSDTTVLLLGASGTGKDLAASTLHRHSRRSSKPFVAVNCAAIPASLAESELFGHERGAFTDAKEARYGRFEQAQGGTIFLDEVGELSPDTQARLLRVLQDRTFSRVGGNRTIAADVRVIAATNRDLGADVEAGRFRSDLFWRLNVFPLTLPPLRERFDDVPLLVDHLLDRLSRRLEMRLPRLSSAALQRLVAYDWPGNIRELENVLERALILIEGDVVDVEHLPLDSVQGAKQMAEALDGGPSLSLDQAVSKAAERVERRLIEEALATHKNRTKAAGALGISRRTLFNKLQKLGMVVESQDSDSD